jgi:flagellin-like hook-associated protein FlgL
MSMGVSNLGATSPLTLIMHNNQTQLTTLGDELSSGQAQQTLAGYGAQGQQVLDLNNSIAAANAYVGSTTTVSTYLNGYDDSLTQLVKDANQLSQGLSNLTSGAGGNSTLATLGALVNGLNVDVSATLNTQVGNRYIFSGTRYGTPPVLDIGSLPPLAAPAPFAAVASPLLPAYDTDAASAPAGEAAAWAQPTATIAPGEAISYGVTSNDPAIQRLVFALQNASAATAATGATQTQYISLAQSAVQQALSGLQTLQAQNGANLAQVTSAQTAQKQSVATLTNILNGITGVDTTQISIQIANLQTQMDASYKITNTLLNLSLASFLTSAGVP